MYEDPKAKIDEIIQNGFDFNFGDYISRGYQLLGKNLGGFILFTLLFFVIIMVVQLIPLIGPIATNLFITPALTAGAYLVANKISKGEPVEFGNFFKGFDNVGQLALTVLVTSLIVIVSLIPFFIVVGSSGIAEWILEAVSDPMSVQGTLPPMPPAWSLILLLPAVYLGIAYGWAIPCVVFYKMNFWDAMESSRKLISKKWFIFFLFAIVIGLLAGLGAIILLIGLLATIPAAWCMTYAAFEDVTQLLNEETDSSANIEQHLVD